jgi:dTDP-4-dehydrorhamnose reductase
VRGQGAQLTTIQSPLELWGGVECTINRVRDRFHDQCALTGHRRRVEADLELFAGLGLRTLRTGLLWEQFCQDGSRAESWNFADLTLRTMQRLHMHPIVGLLHHGSGPHGTDLLDPGFPEKLAAYALAVARRFPEITDYTPVNEPQTTARFACLYRHWYPHHASMRSYARSLLNQLKGIVLSMEAIRTVQPQARLIHTEDGGVTYASPLLESFAREREHRRWLGLDLLCGRVTREHPMFQFLLSHGIAEREIQFFAERQCAPGVIGVNYYVTSDRYLDHRVHLYKPFMRGGDTGSEPLVDTEAVRVRRNGIAGIESVLMQTWRRYGLPLAVTEAHLGCEPKEQIRWLMAMWQGTREAIAAGADVRAVTVWGLLGLHHWNHLCTRPGAYEAGVFDTSSGAPVPSDLAGIVRALASGTPIRGAAWNQPGWWQKRSRLIFAEETEAAGPERQFDPELQRQWQWSASGH